MPLRGYALAFLVAALLAGCDNGPTTRHTSGIRFQESPPELFPGLPARPLEGRDSNDQPLNLADASGKVVLVTFWQTECPPCRLFTRQERSLAVRYRNQPFALFGVTLDRSADKARRTQKAEEMTWPSLMATRKILEDWNVEGTPTVFLIDAHGQIRYTQAGVPNEVDLRRLIDQLLAEIK